MKLPWLKFTTGDWLKDPLLGACCPATRGIWIDLIAAMHELRVGELKKTVPQLARIARCTTPEMSKCLAELKATGTADVCFRDEVVTVGNRRMKRECKNRKMSALRMKKMRSDGNVTSELSSDLSLKSERRKKSTDHKLKSDKGSDKVLAKLNPAEKACADLLEKLLGDQWVNDSGKWINRVKTNLAKCERVAAEVKSAVVEDRIKTQPAQFAEYTWKDFK